MKLYLLIIFFATSTSTFFQRSENLNSSLISCDSIPELNKKIIAFVNTQMNKKVGAGECWDLAASALNLVEASWDKNYKFGKEIDPQKDCVYPGDIVQFTDVTVEYTEGNRSFKDMMAQHTAIIYTVKAKGDYVLADQNTSTHGRKVGLSPFNLKNISKGKIQVYRPTK